LSRVRSPSWYISNDRSHVEEKETLGPGCNPFKRKDI